MIPSDILSESERIRRIGEFFATAAERYWRAERLAGRVAPGEPQPVRREIKLSELVNDAVERQMLDFIDSRIEVTPRELHLALGISRATATRKLARLRAAGLIVPVGKTRQVRYTLRGPDGRN
jgi:CRP-like cAMP-binding protein